jgi:2-dehydro-3-deoxygluconokinase
LYDREHSAICLAKADEYDFLAALEGIHWLHISGITPAISESAFQSNLELVKEAKEKGVTVSCDLNFRKKLWKWSAATEPRALARECMSQTLPYVDLVIGNEEDAADVLGIEAAGSDVTQGQINSAGYTSVARQICERYPQVQRVAITLRESLSADHNNWGGMLYERADDAASFAPLNQQGAYSPYPIRDIVDRVGAGDSFAAGLLHKLGDQTASAQDAIDFAVAASCLKHSIHGDFNYTTETEVAALAAGNRSGRVQR